MKALRTFGLALLAVLVGCGGAGGDDAEVGTRSSAAVAATDGPIACSDYGAGLVELKTEIAWPYGLVNVSDGTLTATLNVSDYRTVYWSANIGVNYALVRDYYGFTTIVDYAPAALSDGPIFTSSAMPVVSVHLCYDPASVPPPVEPEESEANVPPELEAPGATDPDPGCTVSLGYWKNHAWPSVTFTELSPFFTSDLTYHQVLAAPPKGNAYFQLAHQFVAARLNADAGAEATSVSAELAQATALFEAYTPATALAAGASVRATFVELARTLGAYNEGEIGPGSCE